jgi:hypothetical protein
VSIDGLIYLLHFLKIIQFLALGWEIEVNKLWALRPESCAAMLTLANKLFLNIITVNFVGFCSLIVDCNLIRWYKNVIVLYLVLTQSPPLL